MERGQYSRWTAGPDRQVNTTGYAMHCSSRSQLRNSRSMESESTIALTILSASEHVMRAAASVVVEASRTIALSTAFKDASRVAPASSAESVPVSALSTSSSHPTATAIDERRSTHVTTGRKILMVNPGNHRRPAGAFVHNHMLTPDPRWVSSRKRVRQAQVVQRLASDASAAQSGTRCARRGALADERPCRLRWTNLRCITWYRQSTTISAAAVDRVCARLRRVCSG